MSPEELAHTYVTVTRTNYKGWADSLVISNGKVEAIVVPEVGRVMQFRFADESDGPFWENEELFGQSADPNSQSWRNFGGDKTWPAPQSDWTRMTPRSWPPPPAFDSMPVAAQVDGWRVTLISPVDPFYGIQTYRDILLDPLEARMVVKTTYEKVEGRVARVGIWTITQLDDPVVVYAPIPRRTMFSNGYNLQSDEPPLNLERNGRLISLTRNPEASHKIGTDGNALLWVGTGSMMKIETTRQRGKEYPDNGSSTEVYTNADPLKYVELEFLGSIHDMEIGDRVDFEVTYTLHRRRDTDPEKDARLILEELD